MTITKILYKEKKEIPENFETDLQYLKYVKLLRQYFVIKNDEERLQSKFNEIIAQHQNLVQAGIIVVGRRD
jgi:hypothetical protein